MKGQGFSIDDPYAGEFQPVAFENSLLKESVSPSGGGGSPSGESGDEQSKHVTSEDEAGSRESESGEQQEKQEDVEQQDKLVTVADAELQDWEDLERRNNSSWIKDLPTNIAEMHEVRSWPRALAFLKSQVFDFQPLKVDFTSG